MTLAGPIAAYDVSAYTVDSASEMVFVRDLRTGRVLTRVLTGPSVGAENSGAGPAVAIVLERNGAVAWIAESPVAKEIRADVFEHTYAVEEADGSTRHLLASGTGIDPSSLALGGDTLYWTEDGKPFSARLD